MTDINDLRRLRAEAAESMEARAAELADLEGAEEPDAEAIKAGEAAFAKAEADFERHDKAVKRAEAAERARAAAAVPADQGAGDAGGGVGQGGAGATTPARPINPDDKGVSSALFLMGLAAGRGDPVRGARIMEQRGHSAIGAALNTAADGEGGVLQPEAYTGEVIDLLRARTLVRRAGARTVDMPAGRLRDAVLTGGSTAAYRGEAAAITVSEPTFDNRNLDFKSLASIVLVSEELLQFASPSVARVVRDDMIAAQKIREDVAFLRSDGSSNTPTGIKSWAPAANVITANATVNPANVEADLLALKAALERSNLDLASPGWGMHPDVKNFLSVLRDGTGGNLLFPELRGSDPMLWEWPVHTTTSIPVNLGAGSDETEIYAAEFSDLNIGEAGEMRFRVSQDAVVSDGEGGFISAFERNLIGMRMVTAHDFAPMHDVSCAMIEDAVWTL